MMSIFDFKVRRRLRMVESVAAVVIACSPFVAQAQEQVKSRMFDLTYTNGTRQEPGDRKNAVEGVTSLDLRDLEDRAKETRLE